jgi:predicted N-formylglutamate amidohydrolase
VRIPGNQNLSPDDKEQRRQSIFWPYQHAIAELLQWRKESTVLISIHSFTPNLNGEHRPWQAGVACYRDPRLARALYNLLQQDSELTVGFNQPYAIESAFDYTVPVQGEARGLLCAMVEIRQDGIASLAGAEGWAKRLAKAWNGAASALAIALTIEPKTQNR